MADTIGGLQKHIASLQEFCDMWKMKVNINKTQIMIFRKGGRIAKNENWCYKNNPLEIVERINTWATTFYRKCMG